MKEIPILITTRGVGKRGPDHRPRRGRPRQEETITNASWDSTSDRQKVLQNERVLRALREAHPDRYEALQQRRRDIEDELLRRGRRV